MGEAGAGGGKRPVQGPKADGLPRLRGGKERGETQVFDAGTLRPAHLPKFAPQLRCERAHAEVGIAGLLPKDQAGSATSLISQDDEDVPFIDADKSVHAAGAGSPGVELSSATDGAGVEMELGSSTLIQEDEAGGSQKESAAELEFRAGDVLNERICVAARLGAGAFGAVYMARDKLSGASLAVKVQRAGQRHSRVARDEIALLALTRRARLGRGAARAAHATATAPPGANKVVELHGAFTIAGPRGRQVCVALELLGPSLLDLMKDYGYAGVPLSAVRAVTRDVLLGLRFLHEDCHVIHTDVKPENVLLKPLLPAGPGGVAAWWQRHAGGAAGAGGLELEKGWARAGDAAFSAKVVDLGNACEQGKEYTEDIQTVEYRAPEVILAAGYGPAADLWSLACVVFELVTGEYLFDPHQGTDAGGAVVPPHPPLLLPLPMSLLYTRRVDKSGGVAQLYDKDEDLLALHQELLGPLPASLLARGRLTAQLVHADGRPRRIPGPLKPWALADVLADKYAMPRAGAEALAEFLHPMLAMDPRDRASAAQMLQHPWLQEPAA